MSRFLFLMICIFAASCNLEQKSYNKEIEQMKDSIFSAFPTVNRVSVEVKQDFGSELNITLGDGTIYKGSEEERLKVTHRSEEIARHVFHPNDLPPKGSVIFVPEENTIDVDEASKKVYPMVLK